MPARMRLRCAAVLAVALVWTGAASARTATVPISAAPTPTPQRMLSAEDIVRTEMLGAFAWLGDAPLLEITPPLAERPFFQSGLPWAAARVLTVGHPGSPLRPFFPHGEGAGYSIASVSPDQRWVLLRETTAQGTAVVLVDARTGQRRPVSPTPFNDYQDKGFTWISDTEFLFSVRTISDGNLPTRPIHVAADALAAAWSTTRSGRASTASVISSRSVGEWPRPFAGQLFHVNAVRNRATPIAEGVYLNNTLSPSGRYVSALRRGEFHAMRPRDGALTPFTDSLAVLRLRGPGRAEARGICAECEVVAESILWADSADELYFFAKPRFASWRDGAFHRYRADSDELVRLDLGGLQWAGWEYFPSPLFSEPKPYPLLPLSSGAALFARDADGSQGGRWMFLRRTGGTPENLGGEVANQAGAALAIRGDCLIARAGVALWRFCAGEAPVNLTQDLGEVIDAFTRERKPDFGLARPDRGAGLLAVEVKKDGVRSLYGIDPMSGNSRRVATLAKSDRVLSIADARDAALVADANETGTAIFHVAADRRTELVRVNSHFREIRWPRAHKITYQAEGETLSSCVLRLDGVNGSSPPPIIAYVYPDIGSREDCDRFAGPGYAFGVGAPDVWTDNYLAALGYTVVMAATPRRLLDTEEEASARLAAVVEAAVDATGREGLGDASRVGLFGVSQGGYSVLKVLTQTGRFRAAIAAISQADYASDYGDLHLVSSIAPRIHGWGDKAVWYQADNGLVAPDAPWRNPHWFLRSSPYMHADKVTTPLLLVGTDLDTFASLNQFGMMFTALWHERRNVDFVRYWGEGHGLENPHNIRDFDARVRAWFGALLAGDGKLPPPGNQWPTASFDEAARKSFGRAPCKGQRILRMACGE